MGRKNRRQRVHPTRIAWPAVHCQPGKPVFLSFLLLLMSAILHGGCSQNEDGVILPGERIAVLGELPVAKTIAEEPLLAFQLPRAQKLASWPQTDRNASHAPGHILLNAEFTRQWSRDIGSGFDSRTGVRLRSQPIIAENKIFTLDIAGDVSAVSAENGQLLWQISLSEQVDYDVVGFGGGLAYDHGRLFVTSGYGVVSAISPGDGQILWSNLLETPFRAPPTVAGKQVYAINHANRMYVFDTESGALLWDYQAIAGNISLAKAAAPAVQGELVVAPFSSGEIIALQSGNGAFLWAETLNRTG